MAIRLLLILSLVAQLAFSFQCCELLVIHPSLVCAAPAGRAVTVSDGGEMRAQPCRPVADSCGSRVDSCAPVESACGRAAPAPDDDEPAGDCDDGDCNVVIPTIPLKDKAGALVVLLPALLVAYLHRADFEPRSPRVSNPSTAPRVCLGNQARRALLAVWLN